MKIKTSPEFEEVMKNYPRPVKEKMIHLRKLVEDTADELGLDLEETLKWGEPSFLAKKGSTIRMDWKEKSPDQYAMYFKCTSRLVSTFRLVFGDHFTYEGDRAIIFDLNKRPPIELKQCIKAALTYHKVKQLPTLGI